MKRDLQKERPPPLKIIKHEESKQGANTHTRQPVIIHTYSPEVLMVEACNFMKIVQGLTGPSPPVSPLNKKPRSSLTDDPCLSSIESLNYACSSHLNTADIEEVLNLANQEANSPYFVNPNPEFSNYPNCNPNPEFSNYPNCNPNSNPKSSTYPKLNPNTNPTPKFSTYPNLNLNTNPNSNPKFSTYPNLNLNTNPNPNLDLDPNPNPNPLFSSSSRTKILPPFVKPSLFPSHWSSFKHNSSLLSPLGDPMPPLLSSPSFFDLSPSLLPSPSTFFSIFSPMPLKDDSNSFAYTPL